MKVAFATLVIVGATLSNAIAVADPSANADARKLRGGKKGWCGVAGTSCARDVATCGIPGSPCARLKRSADAVADAFALAEANADPEARRKLKGGKKGWCGVAGTSCAKARRSLLEVGEHVEDAVTNIYAREADAEADAEARKKLKGGKKGWCGVAGTSCARRVKFKREAEPVADAEARKKLKGGKKGWCGVAGTSCAKAKRDAEADAEAEARKLRGGKKGWCGVAGTSCARDADPEADPEARRPRGGKKGWCGVAGTSCAKVKRDLETEEDSEDNIVARSFDDADIPSALENAHAAFMHIKREDEAIAEEATPFELLAFCDQYDCDEETIETIAKRAAGTFDERDAEACYGPDGACTIAKRQLDEIEAKLTAAVEAL